MPGLGYATTERLNQESLAVKISIDESVCGMLFDICHRQDPFDDYPLTYNWFGGGQVQVINNIEEAEEVGISEGGFMGGVPYYHIKRFYDFIGADKPIYIMFSNCKSNEEPNFDAIQTMQRESNGSIYQIGIWTEWPLWKVAENNNYIHTDLLAAIKIQTDELCGIIGEPTNSASPLSVILCANTACLENDISNNRIVDYNKIPNLIELNQPKVSIILGQDGTDEVHSIQQSNHNYTPVGMLGIALACISIAPAEESIGRVERYNLNKNDDMNNPELGFGSVGADNYYSPISDINNVRANIISLKGYIIPTRYKAKESELFFSNDQTLSEKDYLTLANNRVIHKCRRIIKSVMLPYIGANMSLDPATGKLSTTSIAVIITSITEALDKNMLNVDGQSQINGRTVIIDEDQNILDNDELKVDVSIIPAGSNAQITMEELYSI